MENTRLSETRRHREQICLVPETRPLNGHVREDRRQRVGARGRGEGREPHGWEFQFYKRDRLWRCEDGGLQHEEHTERHRAAHVEWLQQ